MVKKPVWDKQEGAPLIISNPEGKNPNPPLAEALMPGQTVTGMIGGVEVVAQLSEILSSTTAHAKIIQIIDGAEELASHGDLYPGDTVLIMWSDMYSIEID